MTFPDQLYVSMADYMEAYINKQQEALSSVDRASVCAATEILDNAYQQGRTVYVCGNGGSAAIANHMICDHGKLIQTDTNLRVSIHSLCNSNELITAIANDISYDEIFSYPLSSMGKKDDVLLAISGSGESKNIIKAIEAAKERGMTVISFTGFSGGKAAEMSDMNVHVPCDNYAIIEDIHQSLMQIIAQFIRMKHMDPDLISKRLF